MFTDFKKAKDRLNKQYFNLVEGDDSWGFEESPLKSQIKLPLSQKILYAIVIGYFMYYLYQAIIFIF